MRRPCLLLTRPEEESRRLACRLATLGFDALVLPTLEIVPTKPDASGRAVLDALDTYQFAVFISRNAVRFGLDLIDRRGGWPASLQAAAVGPATAEALSGRTTSPVLVPKDGADSEALLRCAAMHEVEGLRIAIFRGLGGRETLAETLRERGAQVDYVECYRRDLPELDRVPLLTALNNRQVAGSVAASSEGLGNLVRLIDDPARSALLALPLFVQHANVAQRAQRLGFAEVIVFHGGDDGLCEALTARLGIA